MSIKDQDPAEEALEERFAAHLIRITDQAVGIGYYQASANFFKADLRKKGAVAAVKDLLKTRDPQKGFEFVAGEGYPQFTAEALVVDPTYQDLFTEQEVEEAWTRLKKYDYPEK